MFIFTPNFKTKNMKTTTKEFNLNNEVRISNARIVRVNTQLIRDGKNTLETDKELHNAEAVLECQKEVYFDKLETVNVSYWVGYYKHYSNVIKIGKTYYHRFEKMTQSNGFRSVIEIEDITEKMKSQMLSDSYAM
jgi:hypothetical protein